LLPRGIRLDDTTVYPTDIVKESHTLYTREDNYDTTNGVYDTYVLDRVLKITIVFDKDELISSQAEFLAFYFEEAQRV
jgi:hypothetical protein